MRSVLDFQKIYIHKDFVDFRKSINGLSTIVVGDMELRLEESSLFIFCNKPRTHMKMLYFDRNGFALWLKRLETAKFPWPKKIDQKVVEISQKDMALILDGINIWTRFENIYFEEII